MKKTSTLFLLFLLLLCSGQLRAQGNWSQLSSFSGTARHSAVSFVLNDMAYIGTGKSESASHNDFWKYDPATDSWTQVADFPGAARQGATAFTIGNKGYIGTGQTGATYYKDFYAYDAATNTWTGVAPFIGSERYGAVSFTINDKAYVGTGRDATGAMGDFYAYDATTETWTAVAGTGARQNASAFTISGKGYIASGVSYNGGMTTVMSDVREYDPATNSWTKKIDADSKLSSKHNAAAVTFNNKGYILGGNSSNQVVIYDPASNSLTTNPSFSTVAKRVNLAAFTINNTVYAGLGYHSPDFWTTTYLNDLWTLEAPKAPQPPVNLKAVYDLPPPPNGPRVNLSFRDNSDNEDGFILYRSTDGGVTYEVLKNFDACTDCSQSTTMYQAEELTTYYFKAAAYNAVDTAFTEPVVVKTPLRKPFLFSVTEVSNQYILMQVGKTAPSIAKNFVIERALASENIFSPLDTITGTEINKGFTDFTVLTGETYKYVVYGITDDGERSPTTDTLTVTALEASSWLSVAKRSSDSYQGVFLSYGDSLYMGGTSKVFSSISLVTGKEKMKQPLPQEGYGPSSFTIGDKGYYVGGYMDNAYSDKLWAYSFEEDSWNMVSTYPGGPASFLFSFIIDGKAYIGGGQNSETNHSFYAYSPGTNEWESLANIPAEISSSPTSAAYKGKGYLLSGKKLYEYDPLLNTWTLLQSFGEGLNYYHNLIATSNGLYILTPEELLEFNFSTGLLEFVTQRSWGTAFHLFSYLAKENSILLYTRFFYNDINNNNNNIWQLTIGTPIAPQSFEAAQLGIKEGENDVSLSWLDGSSKETAYLVQRKTGNSNFHVLDTLDQNSNSYIDSTVLDDTPYTYKLTALNEMGRGGSKEAFIHTRNFALTGVEWLEARLDTSFVVSLNWIDNINGESNYIIKRNDKTNGSSAVLDTLAANSTSFQEQYLFEGRDLEYEVISWNSRGMISQTIEVSTPLFKPEQVLFDSTGIASGAIILNWQNVSRLADRIGIVRSPDNKIIAWVPASESTYIDISAEAGTIYTYLLYAENVARGIISDYSTAVSGITTAIDKELEAKLKVYPNPASTYVILEAAGLASPIQQLKLWNASGSLLRNWKPMANHTGNYYQLELDGLGRGLYYLQISTATGSLSKKIYIK